MEHKKIKLNAHSNISYLTSWAHYGFIAANLDVPFRTRLLFQFETHEIYFR